uniref:Uncharacterized protein n=1 Tax=Anguilla anguilla TaxID=7936 RepID=A0A0E9W4V6_ANGAN
MPLPLLLKEKHSGLNLNVCLTNKRTHRHLITACVPLMMSYSYAHSSIVSWIKIAYYTLYVIIRCNYMQLQGADCSSLSHSV